MLNQKNNTITVETRRIGGGFGGKETQSFIFAAICTLLAKKTKRPASQEERGPAQLSDPPQGSEDPRLRTSEAADGVKPGVGGSGSAA